MVSRPWLAFALFAVSVPRPKGANYPWDDMRPFRGAFGLWGFAEHTGDPVRCRIHLVLESRTEPESGRLTRIEPTLSRMLILTSLSVLVTASSLMAASPPEVPSTPATSGPLARTWTAYVNSSPDEAVRHTEANIRGTLLSALPPGSDLARSIVPLREEVAGAHGRLFVRIGTFETWFALARTQDRWKLTFDEAPLLQRVTPDWTLTELPPFVYHSSSPLSEEELIDARKMQAAAVELEEAFGFGVAPIQYYLAREGSEARDVVGEHARGAGKARVRMVKAVETAYHKHELVHVFALEIGLVNPFIDEGLACALGTPPLVTTGSDAAEIRGLLQNGYQVFLEGARFQKAHTVDRRNVYGLAQLVLRHWLSKQGMPRVLALLREAITSPRAVHDLVQKHLEPFDVTNAAVLESLQSLEPQQAETDPAQTME